jgi:hypothetical protein
MGKATIGGASVVDITGDLSVPPNVVVVVPEEPPAAAAEAEEEELPAPPPEPPEEPAAEEPLPHEPKYVWVDYAESVGMSRSEAESMTKSDLMAALREERT